MRGNSQLAKLADFFKANPNIFIDGLQLGSVAGGYAWRSRVAELRTKLGMDVENRQRDKDGVTVSEYRYNARSSKPGTRKAGHNQHTHPIAKAFVPPVQPEQAPPQLPLF